MPNNGFVVIPRSLMTSAVWKNATLEQRLAIVDLYFRVAYSDFELSRKDGQTLHLKRGQLIASQRELESFWNMDRSKVRRTLLYMKKHGFIATSLATIGNGQATILTVNQLGTIPDQPFDQPCDQHLKNKNIKNKKLSQDNLFITHAREKRFIPPQPAEVQQYLDSKGITTFTAEEFCSYYDSCGWTVGRNKPMKSMSYEEYRKTLVT